MTPLTENVLLPLTAVTVLPAEVTAPVLHVVNFAPLSEQVNVSGTEDSHAKSAWVDPVGLGGVVVKFGDGERGGGAAAAGTASAPTVAVATMATNDARRAIRMVGVPRLRIRLSCLPRPIPGDTRDPTVPNRPIPPVSTR